MPPAIPKNIDNTVSSSWLCTMNNFTCEPESFLKLLFEDNCSKITFVIGQHELGESGTNHLQFSLYTHHSSKYSGK